MSGAIWHEAEFNIYPHPHPYQNIINYPKKDDIYIS